MQPLYDSLQEQPIVYVTRDPDRALGLPRDTPGYFIISNATPLAKEAAQGPASAGRRTNIVLIDAERGLDTWELLEHEKTVSFINGLRTTDYGLRLLVFKNSKKIEQICSANGWRLLNPPAELADKIEAKITQGSFLSELNDLSPEHLVAELSQFPISNFQFPFILQFNHSHTGEGTILIESETQLNDLKQKFPKREVRVTRYLEGPIFTNNNIVHKNGVLIGNISYQITGLKPYTDNPFATVGNDWGVVKKLLTEKQMEEYRAIAARAGAALKTRGWKGLFGIDVIMEQATGKLYLIEINARQPQSAMFESHLQRLRTTDYRLRRRTVDRSQSTVVTTFDAHLASLLDLDLSGYELISISDGMQIIDRRTGIWQRSEISDLSLPATRQTLSQEGGRIIADYLRLPLSQPIPTPYLNNRRSGIRGGLRAQIGKGSPEEIVEEARIMALKEKVDLTALNAEQLAKFLIDRNLGIDCSALIFYTLDAELKARGKSGLKRHLKFPYAQTLIQKLRARFRPIENTSVQTLADDANSALIALKDIQPGDLIVMLGSGERHDRDHVLLVHEVEYSQTTTPPDNHILHSAFCILHSINYTHSFAWRADGKYGHGVCQGRIEIVDVAKPLIEQHWIERAKESEDNETLTHARQAKILQIRRWRALA